MTGASPAPPWWPPGAVNGAKPGSIILVHDIHASTVAAVDAIVKGLKNRGYELVTVSELIRRGRAGRRPCSFHARGSCCPGFFSSCRSLDCGSRGACSRSGGDGGRHVIPGVFPFPFNPVSLRKPGYSLPFRSIFPTAPERRLSP